MSEHEKVFEGVITKAGTPFAFYAAETIAQQIDSFNRSGNSDQSAADLLASNQRVLLTTIARLEMQVGVLRAKIADLQPNQDPT